MLEPSVPDPTWLALRLQARAAVLAAIPKDGACVEIGTWKGEFSTEILAVAKPKQLVLVDPWAFREEFPNRWYGGGLATNQAEMDEIFESVCALFQNSPEVTICRQLSCIAAAAFDDYHFDWIYIDGDHSYEAVLADLIAWTPKMKARGIIACDDFNWRDENGVFAVRKAIAEFRGSAMAKGFKFKNLGAGQVLMATPR